MNKSEIRKQLREQRKSLKNSDADAAMIHSLMTMKAYQDAETVLCYASLEEEINTDGLILQALHSGKKVALPRCGEYGKITFYVIDSLNGLQRGPYGIREPMPNEKNMVSDYTGSICIVPGIAFDECGYRIGYGKGYYDRFLKKYSFISVGLCYNSLILNELPHCTYDIPVDIIITESRFIGGKHG